MSLPNWATDSNQPAHLADEERVPGRAPEGGLHQPVLQRDTTHLLEEGTDGGTVQGWHGQRVGQSAELAESCSQRVVRSDLHVPVGGEEEDRRQPRPRRHEAEQTHARWVRPMQVVEYDEEGTALGQLVEQ
jgi:hypothetical protein